MNKRVVAVLVATGLALVASSLYVPVRQGLKLDAPMTKEQIAEVNAEAAAQPDMIKTVRLARGEFVHRDDKSTHYVWLWRKKPVEPWFLGEALFEGWPGVLAGDGVVWTWLFAEHALILI